MSNQPGRNVRRARHAFTEVYGKGPWNCYTCSILVIKIGRDTWDGNIHHIDGDVTNDVASNLVMMHTICHQQLHGPPTDDQRRRISAKLKGRPSPTKGMTFSAETNAKKSMPGERNPFFGKHHTLETRELMRQPRRRMICPDCQHTYALNWLTRHKKEGKCTPSHRPRLSREDST
jgi:hypothetical protein